MNWIRDDLKGVALLLEPLDALGKGGAQLFDGFERVVEGDDGAIAGIALHVVHHVVGGEPLGVVARDEVPHHHLIALAGEHIKSAIFS